jgi:predicted amidohydrolase YtcJ
MFIKIPLTIVLLFQFNIIKTKSLDYSFPHKSQLNLKTEVTGRQKGTMERQDTTPLPLTRNSVLLFLTGSLGEPEASLSEPPSLNPDF